MGESLPLRVVHWLHRTPFGEHHHARAGAQAGRLAYRAAWAIDQHEDARAHAALAKLATSEAAVQNGLDAIRTFGGAGVIRETGVDLALLDALPSTLFSGTSDIQKNLIARGLGL